MKVYFATGNRNKLRETVEYLEEIEVEWFEFRHDEIRSDSIEEIAVESAEAAYRELGKPVFVEDTGLFIECLKGFPGTYSGWVYGKIGSRGILRLMEGMGDRKAEFRTCVAYTDGKETRTFLGKVAGSISLEEKGKSGFGYDPVFIPEGHDKTFAESINLKNKLSHRYKAIILLKNYLSNLRR